MPLTGDVEELYCPAPSTNTAPVMHQNETYHGGMYYPFAAARLANNIQQPRGGFNQKTTGSCLLMHPDIE